VNCGDKVITADVRGDHPEEPVRISAVVMPAMTQHAMLERNLL
jgi:hypothetical protein